MLPTRLSVAIIQIEEKNRWHVYTDGSRTGWQTAERKGGRELQETRGVVSACRERSDGYESGCNNSKRDRGERLPAANQRTENHTHTEDDRARSYP